MSKNKSCENNTKIPNLFNDKPIEIDNVCQMDLIKKKKLRSVLSAIILGIFRNFK